MTADPSADEIRPALLGLARFLGDEARALAILGEGNVSARLGADRFLVKASGSSLGTLDAGGLVECRAADLRALVAEDGRPSDQDVEDVLFASRADPGAKKPSVEALFHADLLALPGVSFVGHTHPEGVNALLCSTRARDFAGRRLFPDEVVCCGAASVLVPYTDPGLTLARAVRAGVAHFQSERGGTLPRIILLESHGLIALGATPQAVQAATLMAAKAARIFLGAAALGGPQFLSAEDVARIGGRLDEHHRQRALGL